MTKEENWRMLDKKEMKKKIDRDAKMVKWKTEVVKFPLNLDKYLIKVPIVTQAAASIL